MTIAERRVQAVIAPRPKELAIPERLPQDSEEVYARFLSACHLELATLALLSFPRDNQGVTPTALVRRIIPHASYPERRIRAAQIDQYIRHVLSPAQLVTGDGYYCLTSFGRELQGVAFFLIRSLTQLNNEHKTELALPQILARSARGQPDQEEGEQQSVPFLRRSPYFRARIFEELAKLKEGETLRIHDLASKVGHPAETLTPVHLIPLRDAKLVEFDSASTETTGQFTYTGVPGEQLPTQFRWATKHVYSADTALFLEHARQILRTSGTLEVHDLHERLYPLHRNQRALTGRQPVSPETFRDHISRMLAKLARMGCLTPRFTLRKKNHTMLTPLGREMAQILHQAKRAFSNPVTLTAMDQEFQRALPFFIDKHAQTLLERQGKHGKLQVSQVERLAQILPLLQDNPDGVRKLEIDKITGIDTRNLLSELKITGIVNQLWRHHRPGIEKDTRGRASIYQLEPRARAVLKRRPNISLQDLVALFQAK